MKTIDVREDNEEIGTGIQVVYADDCWFMYSEDSPEIFTIDDVWRSIEIYVKDLDNFILAAIALRDELKAKN